jgi:hypothetical protein
VAMTCAEEAAEAAASEVREAKFELEEETA